ncbi:hypothetical protein V6N12_014184 [Hibiscus sabdariffa]|uniref:RNase H type-1 domain-containing protein n=1 Tax=Hibiscus sabdariffa TaxID=183260 RepID=A0ABR2DJF1_9ROSI
MWIASVGPLEQHFNGEGVSMPCSVAAMVTTTGQCDFSRLSLLLPAFITQWISAIRPPHPLLGNDAPSWRWTDNRLFSSKVEHDRVARDVDWVYNTYWRVIWKKGVPRRVLCWILWKRRCKQVLEVDLGESSDPIVVGKRLDADFASGAVECVNYHMAPCRGPDSVRRRWCKLRKGWVKANVDASSCIRSHKAEAGGVMRDESGSWLFGFTRNVDNMEVSCILRGNSNALLGNTVVDGLRELLARDWNIVIRHISREHNKVADALAALGREGPIGVILYEQPSEFLDRLITNDIHDTTNVLDIE